MKPVRLLGDRPLNTDGRKQFSEHRLDNLIELLAIRLRSDSCQSDGEPERIGLFGGLGQGKSSLVRYVLHRMHIKKTKLQRAIEWVRGEDVVYFEVSYFQKQHLAWRFLSSILLPRLIRNTILLVLFFIFLNVTLSPFFWSRGGGSFFVFWDFIIYYWRGISSAWVGYLALPSLIMLPAMFVWLKSQKALFKEGVSIYQGYFDVLVHVLAKGLIASPKVVIIDDLDRASIEQQRAFLRGIARLSQNLGFTLLVCMDETSLRKSEPNPETPEELLRKVVTLEIQLPDRAREDLLVLVMALLREYGRLNVRTNPALADAICTPQFIFDLCCCLLHDGELGDQSPRKIIRLLNRLLVHADQLSITNESDLAALMRLEFLMRQQPVMRKYLYELRLALESNQVDDFALLLQTAKVTSGIEQTIRLFIASRRMQPEMADGWFRLLGGLGKEVKSDNVPAIEKELEGMNSGEPVSRKADPEYWLDIESKTQVFYRLFLESLELISRGYSFSPGLRRGGRNSGIRYSYEIPGGREIGFERGDLPESFIGGQGFSDIYYNQCWLLWSMALDGAKKEQKPWLYKAAMDYLHGGIRESESTNVRERLLRYYWRSALADMELWDTFSEGQRSYFRNIAGDAVKDGKAYLGHCAATPVMDNEFVWILNLITKRTQIAEGRQILHWLTSLSPKVDRLELTEDHMVEYNFLFKVWPPVYPESQGSDDWLKAFRFHLEALNEIAAVWRGSFIPDSVHYAWRLAQPSLNYPQRLEVLNMLACDQRANKGFRWGLVLVAELIGDEKSWLEKVDPKTKGMNPGLRLTWLFLAQAYGFMPSNLKPWVEGISNEDIEEVNLLLENQGFNPIAQDANN